MVLDVWGIVIVYKWLKESFSFKPAIEWIIAATVAAVTFLPWQFYIMAKFPKESSYEYALNTAHFFRPVEGHGGDVYFHITEGVSRMYGNGDFSFRS